MMEGSAPVRRRNSRFQRLPGCTIAAKNEVGVVHWRDPDRVVGADAVFIASASLPLLVLGEGDELTLEGIIPGVRLSAREALET